MGPKVRWGDYLGDEARVSFQVGVIDRVANRSEVPQQRGEFLCGLPLMGAGLGSAITLVPVQYEFKQPR